MSRNFTRNHLRISVLPTQLSKFLEPERKSGQLFTSWDSALFNESNYLSGVRKIFAGKKIASRNSAFLCVFEHPTEYPSTFVRECLVFISHCVSRLETLDEKMRKKNPLNFVRSPQWYPMSFIGFRATSPHPSLATDSVRTSSEDNANLIWPLPQSTLFWLWAIIYGS